MPLLKNNINSNEVIERTIKRLKAIEDISSVCSDLFTSDLNTFSEKVLKPFCELTKADFGLVFLLKKPNDLINLIATYGFPKEFSDTYNNKLQLNLDSDDVTDNWPTLRAMAKKKIVLIKDTDNSNVGFTKYFKDSIYPKTIKSVAAVPIIINNLPVGSITKYYTQLHTFDDEEISFMKTTANIITSTIERNQLLEETKKSETKLSKVIEELVEVNKELDSFVYIASHDLREPLRTIESFISILNDKANSKFSPEEKEYFLRIIKATHKMRRLIEDLASLSRASREAIDEENNTLDLKIILMEVQFELTAFIESKNAKIIYPDEMPKVKGSREKITSIFKNLISNGLKFNKSNTPTIKISIDEKNSTESKVCICFEDNGIGIKKEYHERIFNLFQRLHSQDEYEGTGAGLAIVKKVLEKYNCNIWIESKEDEGSKFFITLPRAL